MNAITEAVMKEKLAQCAEALLDLETYRTLGTLEYLREHPDTYYAICYRFITVIESLFDIGQYILASRGERAESQREVPVLLARANLVEALLAERFTQMYGFRNRLVHAYGTLDDAKVIGYLQEHLDDIRQILTIAKKLLLE